MQNKMILEKYLNYVLDNVSYYRTNLNDEQKSSCVDTYNKFPVLHKNIVLQNRNLFISDEYKCDLPARKLIKKMTSGSTGDCLEVIWSKFGEAISNLTAWKYRKKWYQVDINTKFLSFHTNTGKYFTKDTEKVHYDNSVNISIFRYCLTKENIDWISDAIYNYNPVWILTYPSILYIVTNLMKEKGNEWFFNSIKYIELMGEHLQDGLLSYFQNHYTNAKISNMYGATEVGTIALQCPEGHMHVITNNVFVEILQKGNVLVTSLKNMAMPLVKYDIGDIAKWNQTICPCGCKDPIIELLGGRATQNIVLPSGASLHAHLILHIVKKINSEYGSPIIQFKAIQRTVEKIDVYVMIKDGYEDWLPTLEDAFNLIAIGMIKEEISWNLSLLQSSEMELLKKNEFFKSELEVDNNELSWSFDGISV